MTPSVTVCDGQFSAKTDIEFILGSTQLSLRLSDMVEGSLGLSLKLNFKQIDLAQRLSKSIDKSNDLTDVRK